MYNYVGKRAIIAARWMQQLHRKSRHNTEGPIPVQAVNNGGGRLCRTDSPPTTGFCRIP